MKNNLNIQQETCSKLLSVPIEIVRKLGFIDEETKLFCFCPCLDENENILLEGQSRSGYILIVKDDKEVLYYSGTALSYKGVIEQFNKGRRTPINNFKK